MRYFCHPVSVKQAKAVLGLHLSSNSAGAPVCCLAISPAGVVRASHLRGGNSGKGRGKHPLTAAQAVQLIPVAAMRDLLAEAARWWERMEEAFPLRKGTEGDREGERIDLRRYYPDLAGDSTNAI